MDLRNSRDILALLTAEVARYEEMISSTDSDSNDTQRWRQILKEVQEKREKLKKELDEKEKEQRKEKQIQQRLK
jgi:hypothetical protein